MGFSRHIGTFALPLLSTLIVGGSKTVPQGLHLLGEMTSFFRVLFSEHSLLAGALVTDMSIFTVSFEDPRAVEQ